MYKKMQDVRRKRSGKKECVFFFCVRKEGFITTEKAMQHPIWLINNKPYSTMSKDPRNRKANNSSNIQNIFSFFHDEESFYLYYNHYM